MEFFDGEFYLSHRYLLALAHHSLIHVVEELNLLRQRSVTSFGGELLGGCLGAF